MSERVAAFLFDESGVTAIEYGAIAALIALTIVSAISSAGTHLNDVGLTLVFRLIGLALKN